MSAVAGLARASAAGRRCQAELAGQRPDPGPAQEPGLADRPAAARREHRWPQAQARGELGATGAVPLKREAQRLAVVRAR